MAKITTRIAVTQQEHVHFKDPVHIQNPQVLLHWTDTRVFKLFTMNDHKNRLKALFAEALKCDNDHVASYYAVNLQSINSNSLETTLDILTLDLYSILEEMGLAQWRKNRHAGGAMELNLSKAEAFKSFFVAQDIGRGEDTYIDKSCSRSTRTIGKQFLFIRLGRPDDTNKTLRPIDQG